MSLLVLEDNPMADCHWCGGKGCMFCDNGREPEPPTVLARVRLTPDPSKNVRKTDPHTSHMAAYEHPKFRQTLRGRVLVALQNAGWHGLTDDELAMVLGHPLNSVNKRRGELRDQGLVVDSGRRRKTASGSLAIVWVVEQYARPRIGFVAEKP